jgi:hypothetical protein
LKIYRFCKEILLKIYRFCLKILFKDMEIKNIIERKKNIETIWGYNIDH